MIFMEANGTPESDVTMLCAGCHDHAAPWWRRCTVVLRVESVGLQPERHATSRGVPITLQWRRRARAAQRSINKFRCTKLFFHKISIVKEKTVAIHL